MKVAQKFTVARPLAEVWAFFQDVPAVARCMPGAGLLEEKGDGLYAGRVKVRLGPFGANFEGEAKVTADAAARSGHVEGKGVDRRGGSRTRMVMDYRLTPAGNGTEVSVDADVTLAGAIAQFGRTSLIQETANILVQDFVHALERELAPADTENAPAPGSIAGEAEKTPPGAATTDAPRAPAAAASAAPTQAREPSHAAEAASAREPVRGPALAESGEAVTTPQPVAREIRAGTLGLRVVWAWLKSLLRALFGAGKRR